LKTQIPQSERNSESRRDRRRVVLACRLLVEVYKRAQKGGGRINWGDIEAAYAVARAALDLAEHG
jgi:hypothetical protein